MKTVSHYAGLALLSAPFIHLLYRAFKAGQLKALLKGAAYAVGIILWSATVAYLLSH